MVELGVRAIIRDKNNKILLIKNARGIHAGKWVLPGGKVDLKEKAEKAITREIKEELGINVKPEFLTYRQDFISSQEIDYLTLFFTGRFSGKIQTKADEILEYRFFDLSEIEALDIGTGHKEILLSVKVYNNNNN